MPNANHDDPKPLGFGSSAELAALVEQRCPLRIPRCTRAGCCTWDTFITSFAYNWTRWFDAPPNPQQWQMAKRDWQSGNTGYEAAHNAQRRVKERVEKRKSESWASANGVLTKAARG